MSKHRPTPSVPAKPNTGARSSATDLIAESIKLRLEIIRRQEYQKQQALRAELDRLPPVPEPQAPKPHAPPANEG